MRFVEIDGTLVNADDIRQISYTRYGEVRVEFRGCERACLDANVNNVYEFIGEVRGERHIVQALPNSADAWMAWRDKGSDKHYAKRVDFLALCADGKMRAVCLADGRFVFADDCGNLAGLCHESQLARFPGLEKCREAKE